MCQKAHCSDPIVQHISRPNKKIFERMAWTKDTCKSSVRWLHQRKSRADVKLLIQRPGLHWKQKSTLLWLTLISVEPVTTVILFHFWVVEEHHKWSNKFILITSRPGNEEKLVPSLANSAIEVCFDNKWKWTSFLGDRICTKRLRRIMDKTTTHGNPKK